MSVLSSCYVDFVLNNTLLDGTPTWLESSPTAPQQQRRMNLATAGDSSPSTNAHGTANGFVAQSPMSLDGTPAWLESSPIAPQKTTKADQSQHHQFRRHPHPPLSHTPRTLSHSLTPAHFLFWTACCPDAVVLVSRARGDYVSNLAVLLLQYTVCIIVGQALARSQM